MVSMWSPRAGTPKNHLNKKATLDIYIIVLSYMHIHKNTKNTHMHGAIKHGYELYECNRKYLA